MRHTGSHPFFVLGPSFASHDCSKQCWLLCTVPAPTESPFLRACRGLPVGQTPVWFMRQAGRSLPEYRKLRQPGGILDSVRHPELASEITLQPIRRYGVDAAILYSDIMVPVDAIGFGVRMVAGVGPVIDQPFSTAADLGRLRPLSADDDMPWTAETIRILRGELKVPLIGFAGAPFTLACYLVEGQRDPNHVQTKRLMHEEPALWHKMIDRLADLSLAFLVHQVKAGVQAVQLFDSWVGVLSPDEYRRFVLPATSRVFAGLEHLGVPRIHFGVGSGELLGLMGEAGAEVVGVDWRVPLPDARRRARGRAIQGNLDPAVCLCSWETVASEARRVLRSAGSAPGYIFNLGHGVLPDTDPSILARLVDLVHSEGVPGNMSD